MTTETDLLEEAATASDALTALVSVTDEGLKGEREELRRIADGLGGMAELVPLLAAASSAAAAPLVEKLQGFKGADGVDGKAGASGRDGTDGALGPVGPAGADGTDGRDGVDGTAGRNGTDGRPGADGTDGRPGDKGLNWRGAFDGRIAYQPDDAIEFGGSSFVAVAPIRGVTPPGNGWDLLARRGAQGPSGSGGGGGGVALSNAVPLVESGSGAAGSGTKASKDDHVHPADGGGGAHPNLAAHDALGLATDDDLAAHALTPHGGADTDDQTAAEVPFTPAGGIAATDVQAAIEEVAAEAGAGTQDIAEVLTEGNDAGGLGVTNLGQVTVNPSGANLYGLLIEALAGFDNVYNAFIRVTSEFGIQILNVDAGGFDMVAPTGYESIHVHLLNTDNLSNVDLSTKYGLSVQDVVNGSLVRAGGYEGVSLNAFVPVNVPSANSLQIYYDNTAGAPSLKLRAKDSLGADFTATIPLTAV